VTTSAESHSQWVETAITFLFVPGSRPDRFDKAVASGADIVILDLEDAVAPDDKASARNEVSAWLDQGGKAIVRVNSPDSSWFHEDVRATTAAPAVMLPKVESARAVRKLQTVRGAEAPIVALIESPTGLAHLAEICAEPQVVRLAFGNVDFAAALGLDPDSHLALATARSQLVYAAGVSDLASPIDGVTTWLKDRDKLVADAAHACELGFGGKLLVHPSQVADARSCFLPSAREIAWAQEMLGSPRDDVQARGGRMVDLPVRNRARRIMDIAARYPGKSSQV
jgi:citrate lyase subunit beta/citryl-CoA lyase